jgi:hypothetical protein
MNWTYVEEIHKEFCSENPAIKPRSNWKCGMKTKLRSVLRRRVAWNGLGLVSVGGN